MTAMATAMAMTTASATAARDDRPGASLGRLFWLWMVAALLCVGAVMFAPDDARAHAGADHAHAVADAPQTSLALAPMAMEALAPNPDMASDSAGIAAPAESPCDGRCCASRACCAYALFAPPEATPPGGVWLQPFTSAQNAPPPDRSPPPLSRPPRLFA